MTKVLWNKGEWSFDGELPRGIQFLNGQFLARNSEVSPDCFGVMWDGIGPSCSPECKICDFSYVCVELTTKQALVASQVMLGPGHNLGALAEDMRISEPSLVAMMGYLKGGAYPAKLTQADIPPDKPKKKPPPIDLPRKKLPGEVASTKINFPSPRSVRLAGVVVRPKLKKREIERGKDKRPRALRAGVCPVKGRAGLGKPRPFKLRNLLAPDSPRFVARLRRERRSKWGSLLRSGDVFWHRDRDSRVHVATVLASGIESGGVIVPTLYAAQKLWVATHRGPGGRRQMHFSPYDYWGVMRRFKKEGREPEPPKQQTLKGLASNVARRVLIKTVKEPLESYLGVR